MQKRKSFFNNELEQRFSLRKYTIGLCSVCLGFVTIGMGSQTVKADTVNGVEKSSTVQENKAQDVNSTKADALTESKPNTLDSAAANPNTAPTKIKEDKTGSVDETAPKTSVTSNGVNANPANPTETKLDKANSTVANSNNASAKSKPTKTELVVQPKVSGTSTETRPNESGSASVNPNAVSTEVKPDATNSANLAKIKLARALNVKLVKQVDAKTLDEAKVATETDNQFNFDDWTTETDDTYLNITGYKGDRSKQIVVPNGADFAKAGKNDKNLQVAIDQDTLASLIVDGVAPKLSNTDGQKIVAKGNNWTFAFYNKKLHDISGLANLDTSNVTDMSYMFYGNQISDLSPLAGWNTGNVTNMRDMFEYNQISNLDPLANWDTSNVTSMYDMFESNKISDLSPLANWNTGNVTDMSFMFYGNQISDLSPLAGWDTSNVTSMYDMFYLDPLNAAINSQSVLNKFHTGAYKFDNTGVLASHSENKTFNDGSQILLDKNVVTAKDSATLTFKANGLTGNTYQIKIYNPNKSINIQAEALPTALGTTDTSYQNGYTIITNKFINNGSVKQDISITRDTNYFDMPNFAQYESTSGLITVAKDKEDLGSINITYQNVTTNISNEVSTSYIGNKPYINHTQNTFYFQPMIYYNSDTQYRFVKSAGLTITVPDDVTVDPDTFIDTVNGKTLKATKIADNQYQVVLNNTTDRIAVKGLINVPADKLTNGTAHLSGFGMKYTINTYNDKMAPLVATDTSSKLSIIPDLASHHGSLINIHQSKWTFDRSGSEVSNYTSQGFNNKFDSRPLVIQCRKPPHFNAGI